MSRVRGHRSRKETLGGGGGGGGEGGGGGRRRWRRRSDRRVDCVSGASLLSLRWWNVREDDAVIWCRGDHGGHASPDARRPSAAQLSPHSLRG